jgi:hypothetical protein
MDDPLTSNATRTATMQTPMSTRCLKMKESTLRPRSDAKIAIPTKKQSKNRAKVLKTIGAE